MESRPTDSAREHLHPCPTLRLPDRSSGLRRVKQFDGVGRGWGVTEDPRLLGRDVERAGAPPGADAVGLAELYRVEAVGLLRLAFMLTGSEAQAQDVVHDAFVRVSGRLDGLQGSAAAYLRVAVVNECRSVRRRDGRGRRPSPPLEPLVMPSELVELRDVLLRLSERQRAAVVLRYVTGLHDDDIAAVLGCRRGTVRTLVRRGLAVLRKELS